MRRLNNFSGRLLAAFVTLVDCGQFKLAANRFHVSQSAFSQMISRLEADVGARLFNRDTRHVSLTPEGQTLLPIARAIAADVDAMYALMRDLVERRQGKVALAALPSLSSDWLPAIIADYRRRYPGITAQFFDTVPEQNVELVRRGTVDFALNARVGNPDEFETIERQMLLSAEPFTASVGAYALACTLADHTLMTTVGSSTQSQSNEDLEVKAEIDEKFQRISASDSDPHEGSSAGSVIVIDLTNFSTAIVESRVLINHDAGWHDDAVNPYANRGAQRLDGRGGEQVVSAEATPLRARGRHDRHLCIRHSQRYARSIQPGL